MSRLRSILPNLSTGLLVLCAVVITGLVVRRELFPPTTTSGASEERKVGDWTSLPGAGSVIGQRDAPQQIVAFSDFQCPFCAEAREQMDSILALEPGRVAVVYRHFPIQSIHPHAFTAALASECAGAQDRFRAYHDALFDAQAEIGQTTWREFAQRASVPALDDFDRCVAEQRFADRVRSDMEAARALGIDGTPTFIYAGRMVFGVPGARTVGERVRRARSR
jgi:protein-disulfide isomerase